jgi:hypothetical protein
MGVAIEFDEVQGFHRREQPVNRRARQRDLARDVAQAGAVADRQRIQHAEGAHQRLNAA